MIKQFENFLNEENDISYRLWVEEDAINDINWDITLNFSDIWEKYQNKDIDIDSFIKKYKLRVNEYKNVITNKKGVDVWNDLATILNELKIFDSVTMYKKIDEVYDWADNNNIQVKTD